MSIAKDVEQYIETYHPTKYQQFKKLKYGIKNLNISNPLKKKENPEVSLVKMLLDPKYVYFTCKHIFDVTLMPFQSFSINQIYNHARPLIIATRGWSKCGKGDTLILTNKGMKRLRDLVPQDYIPHKQYFNDIKIWGENGYSELDYAWANGKTDSIKIETNYKFDFEGTGNHPLRVVSNGRITWKELKDIEIGDKIAIYRNSFDTENFSRLEEDEAYLLGLIMGDGGYTQKGTIGFTTIDKELADSIIKLSLKYFKKSFRQTKVKIQYNLHSVKIRDQLFSKYKFNSAVCGEKDIPLTIYESSNAVIAAYIRGLFDTNGYCSKTEVGICAKSYNLIKNLQTLLLRFGIISCLYVKHNKTYNRDYYALYIGSNDAVIFREKIGFGLTRKKEKLDILCGKLRNPNNDVIPRELILDKLLSLRDKYAKIREPLGHGYSYERMIISPHKLKSYDVSYSTLDKILKIMDKVKDEEEWIFLKDIYDKHYFYDEVKQISKGKCETFDVHLKTDHSFISNGFISHNSFTLGLYAMYRAFIRQGSRIVIVGAGFRQSKMVFEVCEKIWSQADVLRDIIGPIGVRGRENGPSYSPDKLSMIIGDSEIIAIPVGIRGEKIRGFRSNCIIADEFDSHDLEIFEKVIKGFGTVSENPVDKTQMYKAIDIAAKLGISQAEMGLNIQEEFNQEIIAGTCGYKIGNLGSYYDKYKAIIDASGNIDRLKHIRPDDYQKLAAINSKHYCIFRIPYNILPEGYLSKVDIDSARATSSSDIFNSEYGCVFMDDSAGFFKKSLIDNCSGGFMPLLKGKEDAQYIIGVDPASEQDNCAIVVLEVYQNQKRVVFCYTTNRKRFNKEQSDSKTTEKKFYSYAAKRLVEIATLFGLNEGRLLRIDMDADGGGREIRDELLSIDKPIYELVEIGEYKPTDNLPGPHIIKLINFQDAIWVSNANHGLKRDMEQKNLLFPKYDPFIMVGEDMLDEKGGFYKLKDIKLTEGEILDDTIEYLHDEIEAMKKELTSVIVKISDRGKEHWTLPGKRSEMAQNVEYKKDRYSALIIANSAANEIIKSFLAPEMPESVQYGMLAQKVEKAKKHKSSNKMFYGTCQKIHEINNIGYGIVRR